MNCKNIGQCQGVRIGCTTLQCFVPDEPSPSADLLAENIVAALWNLGKEPNHEVHRIAFKGLCNSTKYVERDQGGMAREPLVHFIAGVIQEANADLRGGKAVPSK